MFISSSCEEREKLQANTLQRCVRVRLCARVLVREGGITYDLFNISLSARKWPK